jgi:hypothetical protein
MKKKIKKWMFRLLITGIFIVILLVIIVLNPSISYGNKTIHNNYTVYHHQSWNPLLKLRLDETTSLLKASEFYNPQLNIDICLNDGSNYPSFIKKILGDAFARGFYNKIVLHGNADYLNNCIELNNYKWNLTQLLAHEAIHCLQFNKLGLWKSNPLAKIPIWKWEGYAEYVSRQNADQKDIYINIQRLLDAEKKDKNTWAISFSDGTIAPKEYYGYWILVQYCMNIKKMTYTQILSSTISTSSVKKEMMDWYGALQNKK